MASQIDKTRIYSDATEINDSRKIRCPKCKVYAVPRGIVDIGKNNGEKKTHCPNCGHVHGTKNH